MQIATWGRKLWYGHLMSNTSGRSIHKLIRITSRPPTRRLQQSTCKHHSNVFIMDRFIHICINRTRVISVIKWNKLSFASSEIKRLLHTPICSSCRFRIKFRRKLMLLPQSRNLIAYGVGGCLVASSL